MDYKLENYYEILGVDKDASLSSIQKAKDRLKFGEPEDKVPFSMWGKIDEAYNVLSDPEKRKEYDKKLEEGRIGYSTYSSKSEWVTPELIIESHNQQENINNEEEQLEDEKIENVKKKFEKQVNTQKNILSQDSNISKYISEYEPVETKQIKAEETLEKIGKTVMKYTGGALAGVALVGSSASLQGIILGFIAVKLINTKSFRLVKEEIKYRKISKLSTEEIELTQKYYSKLDEDINKLLSEPHNNYKLKICELKYKNQIEFLEKLLEMKLNQKYRARDLFKKKLDLVSTKMQLETAKRNLESITKRIEDYENNQKKSRKQVFIDSTKQKIEEIDENLENYENKKNISDISRMFAGITRENLESISDRIDKHETIKNLSEMNKGLININKQLSENNIEEKKSTDIKKLQIYRSRLIEERNIKATNLKNRVVRTRSVYDKFVKARDFMVSLPYVIKSSDEIVEFVETENKKTR